MKLSKREKMLIAVGFVLLLVLAYVNLVTPYSDSMEEKYAQLEALENERLLVDTKLSAISTVEDRVVASEEALLEAKANLGAYKNDEEMDILFTSLATAHGMTVTQLVISDNTTVFQYVPVDEENPVPFDFVAKSAALSLEMEVSGHVGDGGMSEDMLAEFIDLTAAINANPDMIVEKLTYTYEENEADGVQYTTLKFVISSVVFMERPES